MDSGVNGAARMWGPAIVWAGVSGAAIAGVFLAPATAVLCLGVSFLGMGINVCGMTDSCDETCESYPCIPNEFPHNE